MKKNIYLYIASICLLSINILQAQAPVFTSAKAEKVQLYFNGAEIEQKATASLPKGHSEIIVMNVADYLDQNSVQIKSIPEVTILSVQFSNQRIEGYNNEHISEIARPIRDKIENTKNEIQKSNILKQTILKSIELLDANKQISGQNMNTSELSKLLGFYKTKRFELQIQLKDIDNEIDILNKKLNELQFQLRNVSSQNIKNQGKFILQVMNEKEGNVPFQFNYVTSRAQWSPFYEVRSEKINAPIKLKYNASIVQNTGVDWHNVKLSLSSGYVSQQTQAPTLNTWIIEAHNNSQRTKRALLQRAAFEKNMETMELEAVDSESSKEILEEKSLENVVVIDQKQLNVVFDIHLPYTILSNGKKHSVSLKNIEMTANYSYFSVPKYDLSAFLIGNIEDYGKYNLLSGEANLIFEGMYVGKTTIYPDKADKKLTLSLGKDKQIALERKLISQNTENKSFSSKKVQTFTYEISIKNNKREAISIEIQDQVPVSINKDIKVSPIETQSATFDKEKGTLKWILHLKPNDYQTIRFSFQVESDKDVSVIF